MNWAKQRHVPSALDEAALELPAPRGRPRSGHGAAAIALLMGAMAAGTAYYALRLASEQQVMRGRLEEARAEAGKLRASGAGNARELAAAVKERQDRDALLAQANTKLLELNTELAAAQTGLDELKAERSEIREQLAEFRAMTRQFRRMIDSGRLEVVFRRGRMIVQLPSQVLFASGSAELTDDGKKALHEVARILRGMRNRRFVVAGHTDDVPVVKSDRFADNWDLSAARAVGVTAALIRGGLRPEQLVAAGHGQYDPVARNSSEAGRKKNRRIEIILEPRLSKLPGPEPAGKKR
jgi:chemotaxis protein MotB